MRKMKEKLTQHRQQVYRMMFQLAHLDFQGTKKIVRK